MFTKKTRALSALLTVCMLISMLACFVVPASAAVYTPYVEGELYSATGLTDVSALNDIKDGLKTDVTAYKVTDRAGLEKMDALVCAGTTLDGITISFANDIDMEWENFQGIGTGGTNSNKLFSGTLDGNGFVIKNLLISRPESNCVGLFGTMSGGEIRNLGIASGLIVGHKWVSSFCGYGESVSKDATTANKVYNCWSAATVRTGGGDSGAFVGKFGDQSGVTNELVNCYQLGLFIGTAYGGMLYGDNNSNSLVNAKNSYNYGIEALDNCQLKQTPYSAFGRARNISYGTFSNNAYVAQPTGYRSFYEAQKAGVTDGGVTEEKNDQAVEYPVVNFGANAIERLNTNIETVAVPTGYTVKYSLIDGVNYPVLTYYQGETPVIRRVAHTTDITYAGEDGKATCSFLENSEVLSNWYNTVNAAQNYHNNGAQLGNVQIKTAADLLALPLIVSSIEMNKDNGGTSEYNIDRFGLTGVTLMNDIDMNELGMFEDENGVCGLNSFVSFGSYYGTNDTTSTGGTFDKPFDGNNHVIKNWRAYYYANGAYDLCGGLFATLDAPVKDLGLENMVVQYDVGTGVTDTKKHTRHGMLAGKIQKTGSKSTNTAVITNCWVTGDMIVHANSGNNSLWATHPAALVSANNGTGGNVINSWCDVDVEYQDYTKATAYGYGVGSATKNNVYYFADADDKTTGSIDGQTRIDDVTVEKAAWLLNQEGLKLSFFAFP